MALVAGMRLTEALTLDREIGKGGMGTVWIAKNAALGSRVAVKVLRPPNGEVTEDARRRFEAEARGLAQLDHPNLVRIFDFGTTGEGDPFIVMELLQGEDLSARLAAGPLDLATASTVLRQTCRALTRAHDAGVIHRDIKPANIFLVESEDEPIVKVLDFGVARFGESALDSSTKTGALLGTPFYMSPEQHMNPRGIDHRADLWSVAVVAFMTLTGRLPFEGETITALGMSILDGKRPTLRSLRPELPAALDFWMDRALSRDPSKRYQSAKELAEAFDRARSASPSHVAGGVPPSAAAPSQQMPSQQMPAQQIPPQQMPSQQMPSQQIPPQQMPSRPAGQALAAAPLAPVAAPDQATLRSATPAVGAAPVIPAVAAPPVKRSITPFLVLGGLAIAGLAGGGVWLLTKSAGPSTSSSGTAKPTPTTKATAALAANDTAAPTTAATTTTTTAGAPPTSQPADAAPNATGGSTSSGVASPTTSAQPIETGAPSHPTAAPTVTATAAPTAPPTVTVTATATATAAPAGRPPGPAGGVLQTCWKGNATKGTPATSATASFHVDANGVPSVIVITGSARTISNFTACCVNGIQVLNYGPGPDGQVSASASFPALK